jgi:BirA family biotin operon repressor/biotin-[acetyl-CoA-carboxylase] ligase
VRWTIERHGAIASTQEIAAERARVGASEGTVIAAASQTAGRGRLGRAWASPPGGLYATLVLRPGAETAPARAPEIALVAGLALAEALEAHGHAAMLKWPNDVLVAGRKVAGILCEFVSDADAVLVGVGVNCADEPPGAATAGAPILPGGLGGRPTADECLAEFLRRFAGRYASWRVDGLKAHLRPLAARLAFRGARVAYADGDARGEATLLGVADDGALRLMTPGGEVLLRSGEITPRG